MKINEECIRDIITYLAENLIINIDEHLNTICSLYKLNNKDYIKNIFDDIDTLNKSFKSLKQQFSKDNICI